MKKNILLITLSIILVKSVYSQPTISDAYNQNKEQREKNSNSDASATASGLLILGLLTYASVSTKNYSNKKLYYGEKGNYKGQTKVKSLLKNLVGTEHPQRHGTGTFNYYNGDIKEGLWLRDFFYKGIFYIKKHSILINGYFFHENRLGWISKVSESYKELEKYYGEYNGSYLPHGYGILKDKNGEILQSGIWENGKLVTKESPKKVSKRLKKKINKAEKALKKLIF